MKKEEPDHEEVVLSRWGKIKQWWEMASAIRKIYRIILALFIGTSGVMAVGEITNSTPLRDAAVEVGIVDPPFTPEGFTDHTHNWEHEHDFVEHGHEVGASHTHPDHIHSSHTHPEIDVPANHGAMH